MNKPNLLIISIVLFFSSCQKRADLPNFDEIRWQADLNGCKGVRVKMKGPLDAARDQIKGLNQDEIVDLLGKPDKNELYKRNQKFFIYEISNAPVCNYETTASHEYLSIRFNATGLAKEVLIYSD